MSRARLDRPSRNSVGAAHRMHAVDIPWRGIPGPVWTMAIGAALYAGLALVAVLSRAGSAGSDRVLIATICYSIVIGVVLLVLRERTPVWLLQAQVILVVLITGVLVAMAPTQIAATNTSFRYVAIPIYVAFWMSRQWTYFVAGMVTVTSLVSYLVRRDDQQVLLTWMLVAAFVWVLAVLINYLSRAAARFATIDSLTGMLNRSALATLIELSQEPGRVMLPRTVVVVDIDNFKALNDTHGHLAGDRALTALGEAWRATLRADDIAVRSGGDEFLLLLPKTTTSAAEALVKRLQAATTVPFSYGIADWPANEEFDIAVAHADAELYKQKRARPQARDAGENRPRETLR